MSKCFGRILPCYIPYSLPVLLSFCAPVALGRTPAQTSKVDVQLTHSGEICRDGFGPRGIPALLPKLKLIIRDRAHATRRITKRGWKADGYLHNLLQHVIFGKDSIVALIQYSSVFQAWFQESIARQQAVPVSGQRVKNMSLAKQRFDSSQKPLGRTCLFFEAIVGDRIVMSFFEGMDSELSVYLFPSW